ncbi:unnamed protein product [Amoebophrya sp. A120]|nr:unnamed protein product [Amoebophrya sp. A120]|eukprot:GSA120T00013145001.1
MLPLPQANYNPHQSAELPPKPATQGRGLRLGAPSLYLICSLAPPGPISGPGWHAAALATDVCLLASVPARPRGRGAVYFCRRGRPTDPADLIGGGEKDWASFSSARQARPGARRFWPDSGRSKHFRSGRLMWCAGPWYRHRVHVAIALCPAAAPRRMAMVYFTCFQTCMR